MSRLLRSRAGVSATGLVGAGVVAAVLLLTGQPRAGAAVGVLVLVASAAASLLLVTRLTWLQRTQYRALRARLEEGLLAAPGGVSASAATPAAAPAVTASPTSGGGRVGIGRDAARSPVDVPRADLLADLVVAADDRPELVVGIVTPDLARRLSAHVDVVVLSPWLARETLESVRPTVCVLEEQALRSGAWYGADGTSTLSLTQEIDDLIDWCREHDVPLLTVTAQGGGVSTASFRARSALTFPAAEEDLAPHGIDAPPLYGTLQRWAEGHR